MASERDAFIGAKIELRKLIIKAMAMKGWAPNGFELGGIRWEEGQEQDVMNDIIFAIDGDEIEVCAGSTDPGVQYASKKGRMNKEGTAHLCYGRYPAAYAIGVHGGTKPWGHEAFRQVGKLTIWRDFDGNLEYTPDGGDTIITGDWFCINLHANMSPTLTKANKIGGWSAGCQITSDHAGLVRLLAMAKRSDAYRKSKSAKFAYTLLSKADIEAARSAMSKAV